jgi:uncharacterized protein YecE (DUF72 family)
MNRFPREPDLKAWAADVPAGFKFVIKAHQRITHFARLKAEAAEPTEFFLRSIEPLRAASRLGAVLFQLPPNMKLDRERLGAFLQLLPGGIRATFEFRHESWFEEPVYALLRDHNAALCQAESDELTVPEIVTADFVYMRLRKTVTMRDLIDCGKVEGCCNGQGCFLTSRSGNSAGALYANS